MTKITNRTVDKSFEIYPGDPVTPPEDPADEPAKNILSANSPPSMPSSPSGTMPSASRPSSKNSPTPPMPWRRCLHPLRGAIPWRAHIRWCRSFSRALPFAAMGRPVGAADLCPNGAIHPGLGQRTRNISLNEAANCRAGTKVSPSSINGSDWVLDLEDIDGASGKIVANATFAERRSLSTKGMKMPRLGTKDLESALIPLPPLPEQRRIVAKVDQLMALVDEMETQLATSRASAKNLLDALVAELTSANGAFPSEPGATPQESIDRSHRGLKARSIIPLPWHPHR